MSQVSFEWKGLLYWLSGASKTKFNRAKFKRFSSWAFFFFGILLMWIWNWKLLLATAVGAFLMLLVYSFQKYNWQIYLSRWQSFLERSNRQLLFAVVSGGMGAFGTYLATSIWTDSENPWLAAGSLLQGLGTLLTLGLLLVHMFKDKRDRDESKFDRALTDLTDLDPLKRLIAVGKIRKALEKDSLNRQERDRLIECFQLMLRREEELTIRNAVLELLAIWDVQELRGNLNVPLQIPMIIKTASERIEG